jgi:hypothetical protein
LSSSCCCHRSHLLQPYHPHPSMHASWSSCLHEKVRTLSIPLNATLKRVELECFFGISNKIFCHAHIDMWRQTMIEIYVRP